jgi:hypothetical protein
LVDESWRKHGGKPGTLARALLEEAIDSRMNTAAACQVVTGSDVRDPHSDVRRAMLAISQLARDVAMVAGMACVNRDDVLRLAEAAEVIAAGVRGYVRYRFRAKLGALPVVPNDELTRGRS